MKPAAFDYLLPESLLEAVEQLAREPEDSKIISGGQSLIPMMNFRLARPTRLVDIQRLRELDKVQTASNGRLVGARVTHAKLERLRGDDPLDRLLRSAAKHIAHAPIRTRGTIGGSLAHADPTSEWCLVSRLLDAQVRVTGPAGERTIAVADLFLTVFTTSLEPADVITAIEFEELGSSHQTGFAEFSRRAGDFAIVAAATDLDVADGIVRNARICLGGVSDVPVRAVEAEAVLSGADWSSEASQSAAIKEACSAAADAVNPPSDNNGSSDYRRDLVRVMVERSIQSGSPS